MARLVDYVKEVPEFYTLTKSQQIDFFAYYLTERLETDFFMPSQIKVCFELFPGIAAHTNVGQYLGDASSSSKGKKRKYIKTTKGFALEENYKNSLKAKLGIKSEYVPTNTLYDIGILNGIQSYLIKIAVQSLGCYDHRFYDAAFILTRKLIEGMIIEIFEKDGKGHIIVGTDGEYITLKGLVGALVTNYRLSRGARTGLDKIKILADTCAHNRKFMAREGDFDNIKEGLRILLEELVAHL